MGVSWVWALMTHRMTGMRGGAAKVAMKATKKEIQESCIAWWWGLGVGVGRE